MSRLMSEAVEMEDILEQWFPSFLGPGTGFVEDNFFHRPRRWNGGFRMIQARYIHCALYQLHLWSSDIRFWRWGTLVLEDQDTVVEAGGFLSSPLISPVNEGRQHLNS